MKLLSFVFIIILFLGCSDKNTILNGHDFSSDNWLLVNDNSSNNTIKIIDDENILAKNAYGIRVIWFEEHGYTTCDGILKLYKNGELVAQQNYLSDVYLIESNKIESSYIYAKEKFDYPNNDLDFKVQWDSILKIRNYYPTIYNVQPDNKNIIWIYYY